MRLALGCELIDYGARSAGTSVMTKKKAPHTQLMAHAIKILGSEARARAMLAAGTLRLLVPKERQRPDSLRKLCGAFARSTGKPCQAPGNGRGGRCKLHGGMSTGPRTEQGRRRLQEAMKQRWLNKRDPKA
jgi:hypothetical protein